MASHDIVCRIFLSEGNTSNSEMMFYNHKGEVVQPVQKKFNRVVLWNATLDYSMKQPGFQTFKTEYSLLIKLSRDMQKMQQELEYIKVSYYNQYFDQLSTLINFYQFEITRLPKTSFSKAQNLKHLYKSQKPSTNMSQPLGLS